MSAVTTRVLEACHVAGDVVRLSLAVPSGFVWRTGEFARLALPGADESQWRCYSIAAPAGSDRLVFFITRVKNGAVSPKLCALRSGDAVQIDTELNGMLIESRLQPGGRDLWLFATGTGIAPFIAVAADEAITAKYEHIIVVHGVRTFEETAYVGRYIKLQDKLTAAACITREAGALIDVRIPEALASGRLEEVVGLTIDKEHSRAMLCGNPAMVKATRQALKERDLKSPRGGNPGQLLAENFWL